MAFAINIVILLTEQMTQSDNPEFAATLGRIRFHEPMLEDIEILSSTVGAPLQCPTSIPIIIHRHSLRGALNKEKLREASEVSDVPITHCLANIMNRTKMSLSEPYNVKGGWSKVKGDGILSVIPGVPLLITQKIDISLGISNFYYLKLTCNRPCQWCYCRVLWFCRQGWCTHSR